MNPESDEKLFGISTIHKRPLWLELRLDIGCSGHGSVTPIEYANQQMAIALQKLATNKRKAIYTEQNISLLHSLSEQEKGVTRFILNNPRLFKPILMPTIRKQPELFALFTNTVTITGIESDESDINQIPQGISATLDCRLLPEYSREEFINELNKIIENDKIQINVVKDLKPGKPADHNSEFYKAMADAVTFHYENAKVYPIILPSYSDIGLFRQHDIEGYTIIPVQLDPDCIMAIHAENERIPIEALEQGAAVYLKFIENVFSE